jgi:hypothetical protein
VWEAWQLPPAGSNRLVVALAAATVLSAALAGPVFFWAGRDRPDEPGVDLAGAKPGLPAEQVVVGVIPREPIAFVARETVERLAAAAAGGQVAVCTRSQVCAEWARRRSLLPMPGSA